jgi:hypothetical protein
LYEPEINTTRMKHPGGKSTRICMRNSSTFPTSALRAPGWMARLTCTSRRACMHMCEWARAKKGLCVEGAVCGLVGTSIRKEERVWEAQHKAIQGTDRYL